MCSLNVEISHVVKCSEFTISLTYTDPSRKRCQEILAYKNLASTLPCLLMKLVSLHGCVAQFFISVAKQVGGEPTGSRKGLFFCSVGVTVHIKVKDDF